MSKLGIMSRSQTRRLTVEGRIAVDGKIIKDPAFQVVPEKACITVDGKPVKRSKACTIMLYKPRGIVTTRSDEKSRQTVYDLLPAHLQHLHPVGRLDMASDGLLLMTTDTRLSDLLTDPDNKIPRVYAVSVTGRINEEEIRRLSDGIEDKGELLKASKITLRKASNKESHLVIELAEGKNREIRRMFESLGCEVTTLKRISFGKLELGKLMPGQFREVVTSEIL